MIPGGDKRIAVRWGVQARENARGRESRISRESREDRSHDDFDSAFHEADRAYEPEMHLLGYFFSGNYGSIQATLEYLRRKGEAQPRIIERLNEMGISITMEEVAAKAHGGIVGRAHIARGAGGQGICGRHR